VWWGSAACFESELSAVVGGVELGVHAGWCWWQGVPSSVVSNLVFTRVGAGGKVCVYSSAATDVVADVQGYVADASTSTTSTTVPVRDGSGFVHPGVLVDRVRLDAVRADLAAGREPAVGALGDVYGSGSSTRTDSRPASYRYSSLSYQPAPVAVVQAANGSGTAYMENHPELGLENLGDVEHLDDARAAYTHALLWYYTGDQAHADKAIEIMNAWSATLTEIKFDQPRRIDTGGQVFVNGKLQAGWGGSLFARAGEIIRYTDAGWSSSGIASFEAMLDDVYLPLVISSWSNGANWLMTFTEATIAIGVFTNDHATFDAGIEMWRRLAPTTIYLASDGELPNAPNPYYDTPDRMNQLWYQPSSYIDGLQGETLRDLSHMTMGLGALSNAAETAYIQGVDLYGEQAQRIIAGYELNAGYLNDYLDEVDRLGGSSPASTWRPTNWVGSNFSLGGTAYKSGWEIAHHHYTQRLGINMPETRQLVTRLRPNATQAALHLTWETLTHTT
jgi:hypothetical protein